MKMMSLFWITICLVSLVNVMVAQDVNLPYEVVRINPPFAIDKEELYAANTLMDLNEHYKPSWVRSYISVEVETNQKGDWRKSTGDDDELTAKQRAAIRNALDGQGIKINIRYIPENSLKNNEPKTENFTLAVLPEQEAQFPGGKEKLTNYLNEKVVSKIGDNVFKGYDLAIVKFTIDELGQVMDAHIFQSSEDESVDTLLLSAVEQMPEWTPAVYSSGLKVKQSFAFTVGNMQNCMVNVLNIR